MNENGSLTILAYAEYGDSEIGWGSASKTIYMDKEMVKAFVAFLTAA